MPGPQGSAPSAARQVTFGDIAHARASILRGAWQSAVVAICDAAEQLSDTRTGALMVLERNNNLDEIIRTGTPMHADVIPEMLGGPDTLMIGRVLWDEFFNNNDWPMASAVAVLMILLIIVPLALFNRYQAENQADGRGAQR